MKGAGSQRWFSPVVNVVKWENEGFEIKEAVKKAYPYLKGKVHWVVKNEKYYFQEGLSFSFVNNGDLAVRLLPAGAFSMSQHLRSFQSASTVMHYLHF